MARHRSSATPLAWAYAALIVYASLYPFAGWAQPGVSPWAFALLPWPHWWSLFDVVANWLGYIPLATLVFASVVRTGGSVQRGLALGVGLGSGLSAVMELTQNYLPQRVPSNLDWLLNTVGSVCGALLALLVQAAGGAQRWQQLRERWFVDRSAGALALIVLWPAGLLFPAALPLGLGHVLPRLREAALDAVQGTPWAASLAVLFHLDAPLHPAASLPRFAEFSATVLGLLAPCLVAFAASPAGWRRAVLVAGAAGLAFAASTLSTALNFGPQHALAWRTPLASDALLFGTALALALVWVPRRAAVGLGLLALGALVALVAQAPADAYFSQSLSAWEQGRFIRFHGVAQWVGWLWPYAAMVYLLTRLGSRDD